MNHITEGVTLTELSRALSPCYGCSNPKGGCQKGCPTGAISMVKKE